MRHSSEIKQAIAQIPPELQLVHVRRRAVDMVIEQGRERVRVDLCLHRGGEDMDEPRNAQADLIGWLRGDDANVLTNALTLRDTLDALPDMAEARKVLDPLHAELEAALKAEQEAAEEQAAAQKAVADAEAAAREKALSKVDADPKVKKAREALAGIKRLGESLSTMV